ncbi:peroxiredoxin-like 2C isoform X2 [Electrophorus electricus]|uniref:peroxiredoxin-like 2C isoform X2 n=1 Tax=Electrophorus electricus TaxID=8005 RepID=UPI0015D0A1B4|nr:peroxiredoxin-like 2C isoform X2 [Electrophorus electricus]
MADVYPVTQQVTSLGPRTGQAAPDVCIAGVEDCLIYSRHGLGTTFKSLFHDSKAIVVFVRNFLCYTCKEYVEDLSKIPQELLLDAGVRLIVIGQSSYSHIEPFCTLTNYQHEIYVDPERQIYKKLGMTRGETFMETASRSPHVKSTVLGGSVRSMWRAMTSPAFDFQGDPLQQGGAFIIGPGPNVHFAHFDMNRFDHAPISWLLQLAGMQAVDLRNPKIIDI